MTIWQHFQVQGLNIEPKTRLCIATRHVTSRRDVMGGCSSKSTKVVHPIEVIPTEPGTGEPTQPSGGATDTSVTVEGNEIPTTGDVTVPVPIPKVKAKAKAKPTSLIKAIKVNDVNTVEEMLQSADCNLELQGMWDNTPLLAACMYGHSEVALKLIQRNANVLARNEHGATALHYSAVEGCLEVTQALLAVDGKSLVKLGREKLGEDFFLVKEKRGKALFLQKKQGIERMYIYIYICMYVCFR